MKDVYKRQHYSHDINDEKSLISNLTTKILIDHTGEVWIATHDQGVCKYDPFTDSFFRIDATDKQKGYTARYIYALCEDSFGNIWLCDNGLFKYDKTTRNCTACLPPDVYKRQPVSSPGSFIGFKGYFRAIVQYLEIL